MLITPRSSVKDVDWPAIPRGEAATFLALAFQLEQSQWCSPQELLDRQMAQLSSLVRHARETVPFYRERLDHTGIGDAPLTMDAWRRIPLLTREDIRLHGTELESRALPRGHGDTFPRRTSGSTGEPLAVLGSEVTGLFWELLSFRDDLWHGHDPGGRLVAIRSGRYAEDPLEIHDVPNRGFYPPAVCPTGPMTVLYHTMPIARQAEVLEDRSPRYLLTYPSNARALCRYARRKPLRLPDLSAVLTYGEPLSPDVRAACRETWGVPVRDVYGCEEAGYLALQCPLHEHYHVQSESVLVEILDDGGRPTPPGEIGWVVVTPIVNFAMPLLRYRIGDLAEPGAPCACGRGLPVLSRVPGRRRGQVLLPDGRRAFPDVGALWAAIDDVDQIQVVQLGPLDVEVRYSRDTPVAAAEEPGVVARVQKALRHPFPLTIRRLPVLRRQPNGKYETFTCLCPR